MAVPSFSDLKKYIGKALTNTDWDYNFQKIIGYFVGSGTPTSYYDVHFDNITGSTLTATDITTTNITATNISGAGTGITGISSILASLTGGTTYSLKAYTLTGTWNMDTSDTLAVTSPCTFDKIRSISVIVSTGGTTAYPLNYCTTSGVVQGFVSDLRYLGGNHIIDLYRVIGGFFDSATFNSATITITILYAG